MVPALRPRVVAPLSCGELEEAGCRPEAGCTAEAGGRAEAGCCRPGWWEEGGSRGWWEEGSPEEGDCTAPSVCSLNLEERLAGLLCVD